MMTRRQVGLSTCAAGITAFLVGLFGLFEQFSIAIAAIGVVMLVAGLALTLISLKNETLCAPHAAVIGLSILALALHLYENVGPVPGEFAAGFLLWSLLPYLLCLLISCFRGTHWAAIAGAIVALCFDLLTHDSVFNHPASSTASLALLFAPLWNSLLFAPIAILIAWLVLRRRKFAINGLP